MNACDPTEGLDETRLAEVIRAAELDNTQCRSRIARNDQVRAACQLALIRIQLEEAERE